MYFFIPNWKYLCHFYHFATSTLQQNGKKGFSEKLKKGEAPHKRCPSFSMSFSRRYALFHSDLFPVADINACKKRLEGSADTLTSHVINGVFLTLRGDASNVGSAT